MLVFGLLLHLIITPALAAIAIGNLATWDWDIGEDSTQSIIFPIRFYNEPYKWGYQIMLRFQWGDYTPVHAYLTTRAMGLGEQPNFDLTLVTASAGMTNPVDIITPEICTSSPGIVACSTTTPSLRVDSTHYLLIQKIPNEGPNAWEASITYQPDGSGFGMILGRFTINTGDSIRGYGTGMLTFTNKACRCNAMPHVEIDVSGPNDSALTVKDNNKKCGSKNQFSIKKLDAKKTRLLINTKLLAGEEVEDPWWQDW